MAETSATLLQRLNDRSDSVAWRRLVDLYSPLINAWLRRHGVSAEDAEDLTQEVLEVVVREVSRFQHNGRVGAFRTWLRTITINCLRQSVRSRRRRAQATASPDIDSMLDQLEDPASDLSRRWDREHDQFVLAAPAGADRARLPAGHLAGVPQAGHRQGIGGDGRRRVGPDGQCRLDRQVARPEPLTSQCRGARRLIFHVS